MAEFIDDTKRHIIPRWRPFRVAASLGELAGLKVANVVPRPSPAPGELEDLNRAWRLKRSPSAASDLIDAALVVGESGVAREAAEWVLAQGDVSEVSHSLARELLGAAAGGSTLSPLRLKEQERSKRIAAYRRLLTQSPRNPLLWVDLAREYSILGHNAAARRALRVALNLDPANRFIVRSACRFFLHTHDPERAHSLLARTPGVVRDPWLLSAEIVAARVTSRTSRLLKRGREVLESAKYAPREISELAGVLGTEEYWGGNRKMAKRHLNLALVDPTENAVAQASWLARHSDGFVVPGTAFEVPLAFEATTLRAMERAEHQSALANAGAWQLDEPFSGRPAVVGAWTASVAAGDHELAMEFLDTARRSNPGDPRLLANEFYALASLGRIEEAAVTLASLERVAQGSGWSQPEWEVLLEADRGLLAFRRGDTARGVDHYRTAIGMATRIGFQELSAHAYLNMAMELVRHDPRTLIDEGEIDKAVQLAGPTTRGALAMFAKRIHAIRQLRLRNV